MVAEAVPTADPSSGRTGIDDRGDRPSEFDRYDRLALALILVIHLGAAFHFMPPWEAVRSEPLLYKDHAVHTHRVYLYREAFRESSIPWGYDPAVSAGSVTNPGQDVGAKPQQILGLLTPMISAGAVVRLFLFLGTLLFPLWVYLGCRRLRISGPDLVWIMLTVIMTGWFLTRLTAFWRTGLTAFMFATYFSVYVLAVFSDFVRRPKTSTYVLLAISSAFLLMTHVVGPIVILLPLTYLTLTVKKIDGRWRLSLWLVPVIVIVINCFWIVPLLFAQFIDQPPGFAPMYPSGSVSHLRLDELADLADHWVSTRWWLMLATLVLAGYGVLVMARKVGRLAAVAIGLACAWAVVVTYLGSFVPVIKMTQPTRFFVGAVVFLTIPTGIALSDFVRRLKVSSGKVAILACILLVGVVLAQKRARSVELPPAMNTLAEFVSTSTGKDDRLLIQSPDGYKYGGYETKIFPLLIDREVIGCNFPVIYDPPQFLRNTLMGRPLSEWTPDELSETLPRWGIAWVFTVTPDADSLIAKTVGEPGQKVGDYRAFAVPNSTNRLLIGTGTVSATVNRMELSDLRPEEGIVVLRYRYHPAWTAPEGVSVRQYAVPEDPSGFLALVNPPPNVTLRFAPWKMLRAEWPKEPVNLSQPDSL